MCEQYCDFKIFPLFEDVEKEFSNVIDDVVNGVM